MPWQPVEPTALSCSVLRGHIRHPSQLFREKKSYKLKFFNWVCINIRLWRKKATSNNLKYIVCYLGGFSWNCHIATYAASTTFFIILHFAFLREIACLLAVRLLRNIDWNRPYIYLYITLNGKSRDTCNNKLHLTIHQIVSKWIHYEFLK
jgi:hypothetical protein